MNAYTYDQTLSKVVTTIGCATFKSNLIQIDSCEWNALVVISNLNEFVYIEMQNGNFIRFLQGSFNNTLNSSYNTNLQR